MKLKNFFVLIGLIIITHVTAYTQKDIKIEYGLNLFGPGVYCHVNFNEKFYSVTELGFSVFYAFEFSNEIQSSNLYLSPIHLKFEPRYKINKLLFTGVQMKYGFPINNINIESVDYIEDWISFSGVFGLQKEWNKIFFEIETGLGLIQKGKQPDFALMIDIGFGIKLSK